MNKYKFGGIENPDVYLDENVRRMCFTHRRMFAQVIGQLLKEGKKDKAVKALEYCEKVIPTTTIPSDYQSGSKDLAQAWFAVGNKEKGAAILDDMANNSLEYITWYLSMSNKRLALSTQECLYHFYLLDDISKIMETNGLEQAKEYTNKFKELYSIFADRAGGQFNGQ